LKEGLHFWIRTERHGTKRAEHGTEVELGVRRSETIIANQSEDLQVLLYCTYKQKW
jgi:hypothetical protein